MSMYNMSIYGKLNISLYNGSSSNLLPMGPSSSPCLDTHTLTVKKTKPEKTAECPGLNGPYILNSLLQKLRGHCNEVGGGVRGSSALFPGHRTCI